MSLLFAENDPALAIFLHQSFDHEHHTVDLTSNVAGAKRWVKERNYDLAILDLNLAREEDTQVLQYVWTKRSNLPILVLCNRNRLKNACKLWIWRG